MSSFLSVHHTERQSIDIFQTLQLDTTIRKGSEFLPFTTESGNYFVKACENPAGQVADVCRREVLGTLVLRHLGTNAPKSWLVSSSEGLDIRAAFDKWKVTASSHRIYSEFVIMENLGGCNLETVKYQGQLSQTFHGNQREIAAMLVATYWLGDEDRGLTDAIFNGSRIFFIDFGLCGPGSPPPHRGTHPLYTHFEPRDISLRCYPGKPGIVQNVCQMCPSIMDEIGKSKIIDRIEQLTNEDVGQLVSYCQLKCEIAQILIRRRSTLRSDVVAWIANVKRETGLT